MNETSYWKPFRGNPELLRELSARHREALEPAYPSCGKSQAISLAQQVRSGPLRATLWARENNHALTYIHTKGDELRVYGAWLAEPGAGALAALLRDAARELETPVALVTDMLPQLTDEEQNRLFPRLGYWHRWKVLMRRENTESEQSRASFPQLRRIRPGDLPGIVEVYVHAYARRPGEFWTSGDPDDWETARADVMSHLEGNQWSPGFLPQGSFVWEENGRIVGAILAEASRHKVPYLMDLIVHPDHHRRGIGRALMEASVATISSEGHAAVELAAIRSGAPYRLYQKLGFEEVYTPRGRLDGQWVLGVSPY